LAVSQNAQLDDNFADYCNLKIKLMNVPHDMKVLNFRVPNNPNRDSYIKYCQSTNIIMPTGEEYNGYVVQLEQPIHNAKFSLTADIPPSILNVSVQPTYRCSLEQNPILKFAGRLWVVTKALVLKLRFWDLLVNSPSDGFMNMFKRLFLAFTGLLWITLILDLSYLFRDKMTVSDQIASFFQFCDHFKPAPISRQELILLQTAWQDIQIGHLETGQDLVSKTKVAELRYSGEWETFIAIGGAMLCSVIYGGLHLLGWNGSFASDAEQHYWRTSCVTVMAGMAVVTLQTALTNFLWDSKSRPHLALLSSLLTTETLVLLFAYFLARGYLVVESFLSLCHLPAAVYQVPIWSAYCPHIS
jgi:hypothetical protein